MRLGPCVTGSFSHIEIPCERHHYLTFGGGVILGIISVGSTRVLCSADIMHQTPCGKRAGINIVGIVARLETCLVGSDERLHIGQLFLGDIITVRIFKSIVVRRISLREHIDILVPPIGVALKDKARVLVHIQAAIGIAFHRLAQEVIAPIRVVDYHVHKMMPRCPDHSHHFTDLEAG